MTNAKKEDLAAAAKVQRAFEFDPTNFSMGRLLGLIYGEMKKRKQPESLFGDGGGGASAQLSNK